MRPEIPELDPDPKRETPNEWTTVERPLLHQLTAMGCRKKYVQHS